MKRQTLIVFILLCNVIVGLEAKAKLVHANKFSQCKDFKNLTADFTDLLVTNERSGAKLSGSFVIREDFTSDIDLQIDCHRCTPEGRQCASFTNNTVRNICVDFKSNLFFGDKLGKMTKPPIKCFPFKAGKYVIDEFLFDGSTIAYLPIEGYRWMNRMLFFAAGQPPKIKNLLGCIETEVTITTKRVRG